MTMKNLKEQKKYLKKWFNITADRYDTWSLQKKFSRYEKGMQGISDGLRIELNAVKKLMRMKKGDRVLDIATGTGNYLIIAAQKGAICYGIDISSKILEVAKRKVKELNLKNVRELKIGDADKIPYPNKFFDWITCIGMSEYYPIEHIKKILLEFKRILKPNGKIVLDFSDINNLESYKFKKKSESVKTKIYLYTFRLIQKVINEMGLKILKKQTRGFKIQLLLQLK